MKRYSPVAIAAAILAAFLLQQPVSSSFAAQIDLGVKTSTAPTASAPYVSGDVIPLVRGTAWDKIPATLFNPCTATTAGMVPTPPNDGTKVLSGLCTWVTPAVGGGITINSTSITSGTTGRLLYDNGGSVGEAIIGSGLSLVGGTLTAPGGGGWGVVGTSVITSGVSGRLLYDNAGLLGELALGSGVSTWLGSPSAANFAAAMAGAVTVPTGGTGVTSITANALVKGNGTSPFSAAALNDDGTKISITEPLDLTSKAIEKEVANASVTGTTLNKLAKLTSNPSTALITATTDLDGAIGIVTGGAGTTSNARIAFHGQASCIFDGSTTAGDFVIISPSVAGDCRDGGAARPTGAQTIGRVTTNNAAGGTYIVDLDLGFANTPGGAGIVVSGTTAGTANAQTMAASFSFLDGNVVVAKIGGGLTNTAAATLNINSTGVKVVAAQDGTGAIGPLVGGEFAAGATYTLVAHTACAAPVSADCYIITTTPGGGAPITATGTVTAAQWDSFTPVVITASAQTITLPVAPGLSPKGGLPIITKGNSVTLAPNAADGINGGTVGASVLIAANSFTMVSTSGSSGTTAFTIPLGPRAGAGLSSTANTDGTTTVFTTLVHNAPVDGGSHSYTILAADLSKEVDLVSTFTAAAVPQATGSFGTDVSFILCNSGAITATSTTSTVNGIAGATGIKLGANQCTDWSSDGANWRVALGMPQAATQTHSTVLYDDGVYGSPAGGDFVKISTQTASASADLRWTSIGSYVYHQLLCTALVPSVASAFSLEITEDGGSTWKASYDQFDMYFLDTLGASQAFSTMNDAAKAGVENTTAAAYWAIAGATTNAAPGATVKIDIANATAAAHKFPFWHSTTFNGTNYMAFEAWGRYVADTGAWNGFRVRAPAGNITSGQCTLYGKNA